MNQDRKQPPRKQAAALQYDPARPAPVVVAAGTGRLAEQIVATAAASGVPVRREPDLARALVSLGVGKEISPALYQAVAEVLAWVARVDATHPAQPAAPPGSRPQPAGPRRHPGSARG